ncbi:MAG: hypothetical protein KDE08_11910 [Rhodobacteraceae bacterium]|nr:hypothetical protein [Paracoccaceae bacterium]
MQRRLRLTRRFAAAMTDDAYRGLTRFAADAGITPNEALSFVFANLGAVTDRSRINRELRQFTAGLPDRQA